MKAPEERTLQIPFKMKRGKIVWPKQKKAPSAEEIRKNDAEDLISALADAAHDIGLNGIVDDYSNNDFHLYPKHITQLLRPDHPSHAIYSKAYQSSLGRVAVPWPWRKVKEERSLNEFRERPFEIIGLLMRKVLDGDSTFFNTLADTLREAKREAKTNASRPKYYRKNHVGVISADVPDIGINGSYDWFTRIKKPQRTSKAPFAVWKLCEQRHDSQQSPPTRREIRDYLNIKGIPCRNLRTVLSRMNLDELKEGKRNRKRSI
jgi:hypothetical protein